MDVREVFIFAQLSPILFTRTDHLHGTGAAIVREELEIAKLEEIGEETAGRQFNYINWLPDLQRNFRALIQKYGPDCGPGPQYVLNTELLS